MTSTVRSTAKIKKNATEPLLKLLFTLDDLLQDRASGRDERRHFWTELLIAIKNPTTESGIKQMNTLYSFLVKEEQLPPIKRSFLAMNTTPKQVLAEVYEHPGLLGFILIALNLTNMAKNEDLVEDLIDIAKSIEILKSYKVMYSCYEILAKKNKGDLNDWISLQGLQVLANKYSLAGSMRSVPDVTIGMAKDSKEYHEIVAAILRYPVEQELREVLTLAPKQIDELVSDIRDIFVDFAQGELRKRALKNLPFVIKQYT